LKISISLAIILFIFSSTIKNTRSISIFLLIFFFFGLIVANFNTPPKTPSVIQYYNEQYVTVEGIITYVDERLDHTKLTFKSQSIKLDFNKTKITGKVLIKSQLYPKYNYGDFIELSCKLTSPEPIEKFQYDKYLARYNIYSLCYSPKIILLKHNQANLILQKILHFKDFTSQTINQTIPEPQASFLAGILLGSRKGIPDKLLQDFNRTGVTHIIAISGYNITVISVMLLNLCLSLNINRKKAFWLVTFGITIFTILTGASAAVIRSAIMGILVLYSKYLGRANHTANILIITASIMCLINPKILLFDAGFQLSFLATIGLIYLSPKIKKYFLWLTIKFSIQENLISTLSAIIMTTPLILFQFERFSLVAPIVNLLILSFIPWVMLTGFIQVITGFISLQLGQLIGFTSWLILEYIIRTVSTFSSLPFASINLKINCGIMLIIYFCLSLFIFSKQKNIFIKMFK